MDRIFWIKQSLAALATVTIIVINAIVPSNVNGFTETVNLELTPLWENEEARSAYNHRCKSTVFKRRPLILKFQEYTHSYFDWPHQFSFNIINVIFIYFFFLLMFYWSELLLRTVGETNDYSLKILWLWLMSSLSITCAFFATNLAYDDFLQFSFLTATLIHFFRGRILFSALCFFVACVSRETSLLYLPVLMYFSYIWRKEWIKDWIILTSAALMYAFFLGSYLDQSAISDSIQYLQNNRVYAWKSNFENTQRARESITIGAIMTIMPSYLLKGQLKNPRYGTKYRVLVKVSFGLIILNAMVVYFFALARESRLYFIPLILATPLVVDPFWQLLKDVKLVFMRRRWDVIIVGVAVGIGIGGIFYTPYTVGTGYLFKMYTIVYFSILGIAVCAKYFKNNQSGEIC